MGGFFFLLNPRIYLLMVQTSALETIGPRFYPKVCRSKTFPAGLGTTSHPTIHPHKASTPYPNKQEVAQNKTGRRQQEKPTPYIFQKQGIQNYPIQKKQLDDTKLPTFSGSDPRQGREVPLGRGRSVADNPKILIVRGKAQASQTPSKAVTGRSDSETGGSAIPARSPRFPPGMKALNRSSGNDRPEVVGGSNLHTACWQGANCEREEYLYGSMVPALSVFKVP